MSQFFDGIYVSYPNDKIDVSGTKTDWVGGHGMVIAVDPATGTTRGSEYGRGYAGKGKYGGARRVSVPNFNPAKPGSPTNEELQRYAQSLQRASMGDKVNVTYVPGADYNKMVEYMEEAESGKGFASKPYNLWNHNCGVYGVRTINQAMPWYRKVTGTIFNLPSSILNSILGGVTGIGHAIEQKDASKILPGFVGGAAGGRADKHGYSLPWFHNTESNK